MADLPDNNNLETEESANEDVKDGITKEGEFYEEHVEGKVENTS